MKKIKMADPRTTRVNDLKPGQYVDGSPLECKLILKTNEFSQGIREVREAGRQSG